ncbi:MAG: hypothetical protein Alpg2KO_10390 [Alphaproteobacteria bacterium]
MQNHKMHERGASGTSYGLLVGLIGIVALAAITGIGGSITSLFGTVDTELTTVAGTGNTEASASPSPAGDSDAPSLLSISRQSPTDETTAANSVTFRALFSEDMQNVGTEDWTVSNTTATVTSVSAQDAATYDLTVAGGDLDNLNATISIGLAGGQDMADLAGNPLPATLPATNETYTIANAGGLAMYYQCSGSSSTGYVAFVANTDNLTLNSIASVPTACQHYGFAPLGTADSSGLQNRGYDGIVVEAVRCYNCRWSPGGNEWQYDKDTNSDTCTHVPGTAVAPNNSVLAGMIMNAERSAVGCYAMDGTTGAFGSNPGSGDPETPFKNSGQCSNSTNNGAVDYSGVPDYILCASASAP